MTTPPRTWPRGRTHIELAQARRRTAEALRESAAQFRAVADLVPDLLWRSDPNGIIRWYNRRWMEYTGQTESEAIGYGRLDAIHPDDRKRSLQNFQPYAQRAEEAERPLDRYQLLTAREREVLQLAAQGMSNAAIGERLIISPRTAETHRTNLLRKLGLQTQTDLVRYAVGRGLIAPAGPPE